jgi:hypothetical protein
MGKKPELTMERAAEAFVVGVGITGKKNQKTWAKKIVREITKPSPTPRSTLRTRRSQSTKQLVVEQINLARAAHEDVVPVDDSEAGVRQLRLL